MKTKYAFRVASWFLPLVLVAQVPSVIRMDQEPHHHLVFHNSFVNVYDAKAAAGDSLQLHRHDHDAVAIAIGDQTTTVGIPGKPDVHSKNADGQVRMQRSGYIHSTHVDGNADYFTVAVELLRPQSGARNLCASVLAGEPLNCPDASPAASSPLSTIQPQFESDQTRISVMGVGPRQTVNFGDSPYPQLIVALDDASISPPSGGGADQALRSGDFVWFDNGGAPRAFKNNGEKVARIVTMTFKP